MRVKRTQPQILPPVGREPGDISFEVTIPASCARYVRAAAAITHVSPVQFISAWVVQEFWSEVEEFCLSMGMELMPTTDEWSLGYEALDDLSKVETLEKFFDAN